MFCIAAFIVLLFMGAVSARYRKYLKKAWHCTFRRVTFRACDISFKEEVKGRLLARVAVKRPKLVRAADIGLEIAALLVIILTVWSLYVVVKSGLNLYVYGTCNPSNAASCSLGAEACSIEEAQISFVESVKTWKVHEWIGNEFSGFGQTIAAIPTRMQAWKAEEYLPANATYLNDYDTAKPTAIEIVDPGCLFCRGLMANIHTAGFADRYNLTYVAYAIPDGDDGYKFPHSQVVVQYLEAMRLRPLADAKTPVDWQVLERVYMGTDAQGRNYQDRINTVLNRTELIALLHEWMAEFGYSESQIAEIATVAASDEIASIMKENESLIRNRIKTVKIPTMIFDDSRHDGVVSVDRLSK